MSVFYGGASLRLRPPDFARWPFDYQDLEPFYGEAERLLGVHGAAGADPLEPPRSSPYPFAPIPYSAPAERIRGAGEELGFRPFPIPLAINFAGVHGPRCVRCNTCDGFPCAIDAKNDAAGVLRRAERKGLVVRAGIVVRSLQILGEKVASARGVDQESGEAVSFEHPSSCSPRARSEVRRSCSVPVSPTTGQARGRSGVSSCGTATPWSPDSSPSRRTRNKHSTSRSVSPTSTRSGGLGTASRSESSRTSTPRTAAVVRRAAGKVAGAFLARPLVHRLQNLLCVAEDAPDPDNRVSLAGEMDTFGMERIQIEHRYRKADEDRLASLVRRARRFSARRERSPPTSGRFRRSPTRWARSGWGERRRGASRPDGRVRGLDNLFVTDGSAFPASGGVNPSLTIAAGALRIAEGIVNRRTS